MLSARSVTHRRFPRLIAVFFAKIQPKPHPFLKTGGAAGVPEEQQAVLDHFKF
jgi:hypothetical protein